MPTAEEHAASAAEDDLASRFLERLVALIGAHAGAQAVFGEPVERDGLTVIPVARVRWGVGGGGGVGTDGSGTGGGGGVSGEPIGYIEVSPVGATFRPIPRTVGPAAAVGLAVAVAIVLRAVAGLRR